MTGRRADLGGGDEPSRHVDDHGGLLSELDSHDLSLAVEPARATDAEGREVFAFDPDADPRSTFPQSVASGGPTPEGVILWTRIDPVAFAPDEPLGVRVAADEGFEETVYEGVVEDAEAIRAHDHTVNVDLDGHLDPGTEYYYRFVHDGVASRVGRCRTLPAPGTPPGSVRFAVLACQDYQNGYYGAYHHVAEALHLTRGRRRRLTEPLLSWLVPAMNPHIEFFDSHHWGYSVVEFTPQDCTYVGYAVDKTVDSAEAEREALVAYRVPEGEHELEEVTDEYRS